MKFKSRRGDVVFPLMLGLLVAFMFMLGFATGINAGTNTERSNNQKRAIEAGVAEWQIDAKTGETSFVYIACEEREN